MRGCVYRWVLLALALGVGPVSAASPFRIVTTFYPVYVATLNIAQSVTNVSVVNLSRAAGGCLHDYQMTTGDMATLATADVLVIHGAGLEAFLDTVARQMPRLHVIDASAGIPLLRTGQAANPHVWVSISRHARQVHAIADGLAQADPPHAAAYRQNAERYSEALHRLAERMHAALDGAPRKEIITFHEAFPYFADEFGLRVAGVIEREPGSEPSARDMAETVALIRRQHINAIFVEPQYPAKAAETLARETGTALCVLDPVVTGPDTPDAYLRIMERNLAALAGVLAPEAAGGRKP